MFTTNHFNYNYDKLVIKGFAKKLKREQFNNLLSNISSLEAYIQVDIYDRQTGNIYILRYSLFEYYLDMLEDITDIYKHVVYYLEHPLEEFVYNSSDYETMENRKSSIWSLNFKTNIPEEDQVPENYFNYFFTIFPGIKPLLIESNSESIYDYYDENKLETLDDGTIVLKSYEALRYNDVTDEQLRQRFIDDIKSGLRRGLEQDKMLMFDLIFHYKEVTIIDRDDNRHEKTIIDLTEREQDLIQDALSDSNNYNLVFRY